MAGATFFFPLAAASFSITLFVLPAGLWAPTASPALSMHHTVVPRTVLFFTQRSFGSSFFSLGFLAFPTRSQSSTRSSLREASGCPFISNPAHSVFDPSAAMHHHHNSQPSASSPWGRREGLPRPLFLCASPFSQFHSAATAFETGLGSVCSLTLPHRGSCCSEAPLHAGSPLRLRSPRIPNGPGQDPSGIAAPQAATGDPRPLR